MQTAKIYKKSRLQCNFIQLEEAEYRIKEMPRSLVAHLERGRRIFNQMVSSQTVHVLSARGVSNFDNPQ